MSPKKAPPVDTVPNPNGKGWVNKQGGQQIGPVRRTQEKAAEEGRKLAIVTRTEHQIHRPDGTIRDKNSYGNDPEKTKG